MASLPTLKRVIIIGSVICIFLGILRVIQYGIIQPITGQSISLQYWGNASLDILFFIFGVIAIIFGAISVGLLRFFPDSFEIVEVTAKTPFGGGHGCVLPDGRIVTRKWFEEGHQIRVTAGDGSSHFLFLPIQMWLI